MSSDVTGGSDSAKQRVVSAGNPKANVAAEPFPLAPLFGSDFLFGEDQGGSQSSAPTGAPADSVEKRGARGGLHLEVESARQARIRHAWRADPMEQFEIWMDGARQGRGFAPRSQIVYRSMWRKFIAGSSGEGVFACAESIRKFLGDVTHRGSARHSRSQQRRYLTLIAAVQETLVQEDCLVSNAGRDLLNEALALDSVGRRNLPVALSPAQEAQYRSCLDSLDATFSTGSRWLAIRDRALLELILGSALKVGEIQRLKVGDVVMNPESGEPFVRVTTNANKERRAPIAMSSRSAIGEWVKMMTGFGASPSQVLFVSSACEERSENGVIDAEQDLPMMFEANIELTRPMSSAQIWRVVSGSIVQAGLGESLAQNGPNVLRNTFATRQLRNGVKLAVLSQWLGHKDPKSTEVFIPLVGRPSHQGLT